MKFTIRDLFWLVLVVALAIGWWLDHGSSTYSKAWIHGYSQGYGELSEWWKERPNKVSDPILRDFLERQIQSQPTLGDSMEPLGH